MKLILCFVITLLLLFSYINAESTCLSANDWGKKFANLSPVEGEVCDIKFCGEGILACDVTGNGKKLTCSCNVDRFGVYESPIWVKYGSCTNDANGNWCS